MLWLKGVLLVTNATWRKRFSVLRNHLYLYPEPDSMPRTWAFWTATGLVALLACLYAGYFIVYLTSREAAFLTHAEDLGIMDQAIWTTLHGNPLHMTICNIVHDSNCYSLNGIPRFAIHFEPILYIVALFYVPWPNPDTLLVLQSLVVATGAFPAFWLARLRLRNEWASVGIAALYLLYPAQQFAQVNDFHAVTFTASLLLFTLYFMYTRKTVWLFVFAILSMACKEEIPLVIIMFGLWSILFQHRWRSGLALSLLGAAWAVLGLSIIPHIFSPVGHPLLTGRYAGLDQGYVHYILHLVAHPTTTLKQYVLDPSHLYYLRVLLTPAGYLPLLSPWVLILAVPSIALNLLSSDPNMYSGMFQYNAEIVPVLIFSTIEAIVLLIWLAQWVMNWMWKQRSTSETETAESELFTTRTRYVNRWLHAGLLALLLFYSLFSVVKADTGNVNMPFGQGFVWPQVTAHTALAQHFIDMIPSDASVSAQSDLVPHLSHRNTIYLFPYGDETADYDFLDVTGNIYPSFDEFYFINQAKQVLLGGKYGVVAAQDGYILLKRGLPAPGISPFSPVQSGDVYNELPNLPAGFCSFMNVTPQQVANPVQVSFANAANTMDLAGYSVAAVNPSSIASGYMQVTTDWKVIYPTETAMQVIVFMTDSSGKEYYVSGGFPGFNWCPTNTWTPGTMLQLTSNVLAMPKMPTGLAHVSIAVLPLTQPYSTIMKVQDRLPVHIVNASGTIAPTQGTNGLELTTLRLIP